MLSPVILLPPLAAKFGGSSSIDLSPSFRSFQQSVPLCEWIIAVPKASARVSLAIESMHFSPPSYYALARRLRGGCFLSLFHTYPRHTSPTSLDVIYLITLTEELTFLQDPPLLTSPPPSPSCPPRSTLSTPTASPPLHFSLFHIYLPSLPPTCHTLPFLFFHPPFLP